MKNLSIYSIILLFLASIMVGCSKSFLEVKPKGKLIAEKTNDYFLLYNTLLANSMGETLMWMGDDVTAMNPSYNGAPASMKRFYRWEDDVYLADETPAMIRASLDNLYAINKIINEVEASIGGTEEQKKSLLAEARVYRAWQHFIFINYYGKPYDPATASTDLGFPILNEAFLTKQDFKRETVKAVYDFIETELREALPDLPKKTTFRSRMSLAAGQAYLGKVLVFRGEYQAAIPYLESALSESSNAAIPVNLYDYNVETIAGGVFEPSLYGPADVSYDQNKEAINWWGKSIGSNLIFFAPTYLIPKEVQDQFKPSDKRVAFLTDRNFLAPAAFNGGLKRIYARTSTNHNGANLPDIYLLLAECQARVAGLKNNAIQTLEYFRQHRMDIADSKVPSNISEDDLIKAIIEERKLEFVGMGDRWNTIRRLSTDPLFPSITDFNHIIYNANGAVEETIPFPKKRLVLRIPLKIMEENPSFEQNP